LRDQNEKSDETSEIRAFGCRKSAALAETGFMTSSIHVRGIKCIISFALHKATNIYCSILKPGIAHPSNASRGDWIGCAEHVEGGHELGRKDGAVCAIS